MFSKNGKFYAQKNDRRRITLELRVSHSEHTEIPKTDNLVN